MNTDLLETIIVVSNVFSGERKEKTILFINEELAVKKAERISMENPDCIVSISSRKGAFFHFLFGKKKWKRNERKKTKPCDRCGATFV